MARHDSQVTAPHLTSLFTCPAYDSSSWVGMCAESHTRPCQSRSSCWTWTCSEDSTRPPFQGSSPMSPAPVDTMSGKAMLLWQQKWPQMAAAIAFWFQVRFSSACHEIMQESLLIPAGLGKPLWLLRAAHHIWQAVHAQSTVMSLWRLQGKLCSIEC